MKENTSNKTELEKILDLIQENEVSQNIKRNLTIQDLSSIKLTEKNLNQKLKQSVVDSNKEIDLRQRKYNELKKDKNIFLL